MPCQHFYRSGLLPYRHRSLQPAIWDGFPSQRPSVETEKRIQSRRDVRTRLVGKQAFSDFAVTEGSPLPTHNRPAVRLSDRLILELASLPLEEILLSLLNHRLLDPLHRAAPDFQLAHGLEDALAVAGDASRITSDLGSVGSHRTATGHAVISRPRLSFAGIPAV